MGGRLSFTFGKKNTMFGIFKNPKYNDPILGEFQRTHGRWNGGIKLDEHGEIPLRLSGGKQSPDSEGLDLANQLSSHIGSLLPQIQTQLFEHYMPYRDSVAEGMIPEQEEPLPRFNCASDVWPHVYPQWVEISPLERSPSDGFVIELAYHVAWDEEHTLGARIQNWKVFELCGSTV
jgi:hypothetical protein